MAEMCSSGTSFEDLAEESSPVHLNDIEDLFIRDDNFGEKEIVKDIQSLSCSDTSNEDNWINLEDDKSKIDHKKSKLSLILECLQKSDIKGLQKLGKLNDF